MNSETHLTTDIARVPFFLFFTVFSTIAAWWCALPGTAALRLLTWLVGQRSITGLQLHATGSSARCVGLCLPSTPSCVPSSLELCFLFLPDAHTPIRYAFLLTVAMVFIAKKSPPTIHTCSGISTCTILFIAQHMLIFQPIEW